MKQELEIKKIELVNNKENNAVCLTVRTQDASGTSDTVEFKKVEHDYVGENTGKDKDLDGFIKSVHLIVKGDNDEVKRDSGAIEINFTNVAIQDSVNQLKEKLKATFPNIVIRIEDEKLLIINND